MNLTDSNIKYFIIFNQNKIKSILNEVSTASPLAGRMKTKEFSVFHANKRTYEEFSKSKADMIGMYVINYLISNIDFEKYLTMYNTEAPDAASTFPTGINSNYINRVKVLRDLPGYQKWLVDIQGLLDVSDMKYVDVMTEGKIYNNENEPDYISNICSDKKKFTLLKRFINKKKIDIKKILKEISNTGFGLNGFVDNGPNVFLRNKKVYDEFSEEQSKYSGFTILNNLMPINMTFEDFNNDYPKGPPNSNLNHDNKSNKFTNEDDYNRWKERIDVLVKAIGYEYVNTLTENIENKTINNFLNEIFNITENIKFYITYKDGNIKIGRTYNDLTTPLNIISVLSENTSSLFLSKLIFINDKINEIDDKEFYFNNGHNFIIFEITNNKLNVSDIINIYKKDINEEVKNKLIEIFKIEKIEEVVDNSKIINKQIKQFSNKLKEGNKDEGLLRTLFDFLKTKGITGLKQINDSLYSNRIKRDNKLKTVKLFGELPNINSNKLFLTLRIKDSKNGELSIIDSENKKIGKQFKLIFTDKWEIK
jgi:hypothetical protein